MKILVAMSGGVDSSVAAALLTEAGNECIGCTMKLFDNEDAGIPRSHTCCSLDDVEDARAVARKLGMDYFVFNFSRDFREKIITPFAEAYKNGRTPNPCIDCNRYMKFDKLFSRADILGCDHIATGHYARIEYENGKYFLKKALDPDKDQSYVLYAMTQEQLSRTLFPLGNYRKPEIREIAEKRDLRIAHKPDSQDICFVPDGDYAKIIGLHLDESPQSGVFVDTAGNILGKHDGILHYTIGQRKGLGVSGKSRLYVLEIGAKTNVVVLGEEELLYRQEVTVENCNWISGEKPNEPFICTAKIRYRQREQSCRVIPRDETVRLIFDEPVRAPASGQAAVLYQGDVVLGGGVIRAEKHRFLKE